MSHTAAGRSVRPVLVNEENEYYDLFNNLDATVALIGRKVNVSVFNTGSISPLSFLPLTHREQHTIRENAFASFEDTNSSTFVSPQDTAEIDQFMARASRLVQHIDHTVSTLSTLRLQLDRSKRACRRLTSAMGRLPVEILTQIFVLARHCYTSNDADMRGLHISFNVAQVCRRWRHVALNTPRLWNTMYVPVTKDLDEATVQESREMLSRSSSVPSFLVVGIQPPRVPFLQKCRKGLFSPFEEVCVGVDMYPLSNTGKKAFHFDYSAVKGFLVRFKKLERLNLTNCRLDADLSTLSTNFRNLTHLHLFLVRADHDDTSRNFPALAMPSMRVLILESVFDCILFPTTSFSENFPKLTDFHLSGDISLRRTGAFSHPGLKRLSLGSVPNALSLPFSEFPALTELALPLVEDTEENLSRFILRSRCQLTRITFIIKATRFSTNTDLLAVDAARWKPVGNRIGELMKVPVVEYSGSWTKNQMMREVNTEWYEREYIPGRWVDVSE
ncbi:hypothetical protein CONPUDRAFT_149619 [Coniophora puteana RWD-64-598 SS2]|uniref:F-box domain-containing protein n=1 Tax=Coniophora puteana (strain RWD-64-598) TaxID=741705 RepID=A0A5M3N026_CONPW|nr:uncharacterized protein CONPUDRAFT_149619 [Coniophora puteana RWD-64-598 SS2]EIW84750.1 hypothetical protein CONPUDRAFT_149619 [Coniophora puteana RWD-64-598 SS2]